MGAYETIAASIRDGVYDNKLPYPSNHRAAGKSDEEKKEMRIAYHQENVRIQTQFKNDLFKAYGIEDHPKREKVWQKAWEDGHASRLHEVLNQFDELVGLIR